MTKNLLIRIEREVEEEVQQRLNGVDKTEEEGKTGYRGLRQTKVTLTSVKVNDYPYTHPRIKWFYQHFSYRPYENGGENGSKKL